jgi:hypothetical protein
LIRNLHGGAFAFSVAAGRGTWGKCPGARSAIATGLPKMEQETRAVIAD